MQQGGETDDSGESQELWRHIEYQLDRLVDGALAARDEAERHLWISCLLQQCEFWLECDNRRSEQHIFTCVCQMLRHNELLVPLWQWIIGHAVRADETRRWVMVVAVFELEEEDEPVKWDNFAVRLFQTWLNDETKWILSYVYHEMPERMANDLNAFFDFIHKESNP